MTDPTFVQRLRELMAKATPRPWELSGVRRKWREAGSPHVNDSHAVCTQDGSAIALVLYDPKQHIICWIDANFIVAAVNAIPQLLDHIEALEAALNSGEEESRPTGAALVRMRGFAP